MCIAADARCTFPSLKPSERIVMSETVSGSLYVNMADKLGAGELSSFEILLYHPVKPKYTGRKRSSVDSVPPTIFVYLANLVHNLQNMMLR